MTLTGFDHQTDTWLRCIFEPVYDTYSPADNNKNGSIVCIRHPKYGQPHLIVAADCLGWNLACTRLQWSTTSLQMVFGITDSRILKWLWFGRRMLIAILCNHPDAALKISSAARILQYKAAIQARHPNPMEACCTLVQLRVIPKIFYDGRTHNQYVYSVLVFCPDGTVTMAAVNYPGCFCGSQIADWSKIYQKLEAVFHESGGKWVVESAFAKNRHNFLVKTSQVAPVDVYKAQLNWKVTSMRQVSDWEIKALQSSSPKLKDQML